MDHRVDRYRAYAISVRSPERPPGVYAVDVVPSINPRSGVTVRYPDGALWETTTGRLWDDPEEAERAVICAVLAARRAHR